LYRVALLDEFSHDFTLVVFDNQNLLRTNHLLDHDDSQVGENLVVLVFSEGVVVEDRRVGGAAAGDACADGHEGVEIRDRELLHLLIKLLNKLKPVIQANLEDFSIIDLRYPNKIVVTVDEEVSVRELLDKL
jgi:hypothetical protein